MTKTPLISIIIIGFNTQKELKRLLLSISTLTYKKIETIYVDDGSSDDSYKIYSSFKSDYNKKGIKLKKNAGRAFATQKGIQAASGDWFYFIRSNEEVFLNTFDQYLKLIQHNSALAYAGSVQYKSQDKAFEKYLNNRKRGVNNYKPGQNIDYQYFLFNNSMVHSSVFKSIKLNQKLSKYGGEELDFAYRLNKLYPHQIQACPNGAVLRKNYPNLIAHCQRLYEFGNFNLKFLPNQLKKIVVKCPALLTFNLHFIVTTVNGLCLKLYPLKNKKLNYYLIRIIMLCSILRGYYKRS